MTFSIIRRGQGSYKDEVWDVSEGWGESDTFWVGSLFWGDSVSLPCNAYAFSSMRPVPFALCVSKELPPRRGDREHQWGY